MISKVALFAASLIASITLAAGLALGGFAPRAESAAPAAVQPAAATAEPAATPVVQVDTAYIAAPVKPREVTVKKVVASSARGDDEGEAEGDD